MTTIVAAAGGGAWTVGATWVGGVAPTAADDAQLTVASGNVTIDTGAVCRSLDCSTYVGTLTHTAGVTLTIGDATAGAGNKALTLVAGMTYTLGNAATSAITFASTSATQQTVTSAGKTRGNTTYSGAGSSYLLGDATTIGATATWTLSAGTFDTGGFAMSLGLIVISTATAKTLTLGSSPIAITGTGSNTVNFSGSNLTVTANTAVMTFSGAFADFNGSSQNWNGLSLVFNANTTGARVTGVSTVTFANITVTGPANKTATFTSTPQVSLTVTGTLTITGNSTVNRIFASTGTVGTARTITAAAVSLSNVDFMDITAAGAAGTWTGTSMGNALGNSNITFDAPATQTHTASAGGNWSDVTKWTSRVPLPQDNVIVDVGTTGTLTADMPRLGADVTFTGFVGTASFASVANTLYGSIVLGSGMTVSGALALTLAGRSSHTITSNGRTFTTGLTVAAPGGTYTLVGNLTQSNATLGLSLNFGTLDNATNNVDVSLPFLGTANATTANLGSGVWSVSFPSSIPWNVNAGTTISGATATVVIAGASASARILAGGGKTYGTLTYTVAGSTGSLTITGANTFGTINFSDVTNARSLLFTAGTTTTVTNWNVNGTSGKLMTVASATAATHTLTKAGGGTVSSDYLSITNSTATPMTTWYAGGNSTDGGGNTGWAFTAAPTARLIAQTGPAQLTRAALR